MDDIKFLMGLTCTYAFTISGDGTVTDVQDMSHCDYKDHFKYWHTFNQDLVLKERSNSPTTSWATRLSPSFLVDEPVVFARAVCDGPKFSAHITFYSVRCADFKPSDSDTLKAPGSALRFAQSDPEFFFPKLSFLGEWDILVDLTGKPGVFVSQNGASFEKRMASDCTILNNFVFSPETYPEIYAILPFETGDVPITEQIDFLDEYPYMRGVKAFLTPQNFENCKHLLYDAHTPAEVLGVDERILPFLDRNITPPYLFSLQMFCLESKDRLTELLNVHENKRQEFAHSADYLRWVRKNYDAKAAKFLALLAV